MSSWLCSFSELPYHSSFIDSQAYCDGYFMSCCLDSGLPRYLINCQAGVSAGCFGVRLTSELTDGVKHIALFNECGPHAIC